MKTTLFANLLGPARRRMDLVPVTAYARPANVPLLSQLFAVLAQENETGRTYRTSAQEWLNSRRGVRAKYEGIVYHLEVDDPIVGRWWNMMPIGGRIFRTNGSTWIELTYKQAGELNDALRQATDSILEKWLKDRDLVGKVVDGIGVKTESRYREINPDNLPDDDTFYAHEADIARQAKEEANLTNRSRDDDKSVVYYEGFHYYPSKCRIFHYEEGGRVYFAMSHIEYGGTSPTNMFEGLATKFRMEYYPNAKPTDISWYDHWPRHHSLTDREELTRVLLEWNPKGKGYEHPEWHRGQGAPERLQRLIWQTIPPSEQGNQDNPLHWSTLLSDIAQSLKDASNTGEANSPIKKEVYWGLLDLLARQFAASKPARLAATASFLMVRLPGVEEGDKPTNAQALQQARTYAEKHPVYLADAKSAVAEIRAMLMWPYDDIKAVFIPNVAVLNAIATGDAFEKDSVSAAG